MTLRRARRMARPTRTASARSAASTALECRAIPCPPPTTSAADEARAASPIQHRDRQSSYRLCLLRVVTADGRNRIPDPVSRGLVLCRNCPLSRDHARHGHRSHAAPAMRATVTVHSGPAPLNPARVERGQAMIIVALSMIVLLGIGAIVVDLGLSWILRPTSRRRGPRRDSGSQVHPGEQHSHEPRTKMRTAACFYTQHNNFFTTDDTTCLFRARRTAILQVLRPPNGRRGDRFAGSSTTDGVCRSFRTRRSTLFGQMSDQDFASVPTGGVAERGRTQSANWGTSSRSTRAAAAPGASTAAQTSPSSRSRTRESRRAVQRRIRAGSFRRTVVTLTMTRAGMAAGHSIMVAMPAPSRAHRTCTSIAPARRPAGSSQFP